MASNEDFDDFDDEDLDEELDEEIDEEVDEEIDEDIDEEFEEDDEFAEGGDDEDDDDFDGDDDDDDDDRDEALEELEAAELEIEDDPETLLVDEAAEIREMRREELGIGGNAREQSRDEFVCTECFLVKKTSQLANKTRKICRDCV